jgi:hypothetical protein
MGDGMAINVDKVDTAIYPEFSLIDAEHWPTGKCLLLTSYGTTVIGHYDGHKEYVAFSGLPRIPKHIKDFIMQQNKSKSRPQLAQVCVEVADSRQGDLF